MGPLLIAGSLFLPLVIAGVDVLDCAVAPEEECSTFLQVHEVRTEAKTEQDESYVTTPCPGKVSWATLKAVARKSFKQDTGPMGLPIVKQGTVSHLKSYPDDSVVSMEGTVTLELDGSGFSSSWDCHSPHCSLADRPAPRLHDKTWLATLNKYMCFYYGTLNVTAGIGVNALDLKASFSDGKLTLAGKSSPIDLKDVEISFTVEHAMLTATGLVDVSMRAWKGPWITPIVNSFRLYLDNPDFTNTKVDKVECTRHGLPWKDCIDEETGVFKNGLLAPILRASGVWDLLTQAQQPLPWWE